MKRNIIIYKALIDFIKLPQNGSWECIEGELDISYKYEKELLNKLTKYLINKYSINTKIESIKYKIKIIEKI